MKKLVILSILLLSATIISIDTVVNSRSLHQTNFGVRTFSMNSVFIREQTKLEERMHIQSDSYQQIVNITSSGIEFKQPEVFNLAEYNLTNNLDYAISKHPNKNILAIAIYNKTESHSVSLFVLNSSNPLIFYNSTNIKLSLTFIGSIDLGLSTNYIYEAMDTYWINDTTIAFAIGMYRTDYTGFLIYIFYYKYSGDVLNGSFTAPNYIFASKDINNAVLTDHINDLKFINYSQNKLGLLLIINDFSVGDSSFKFYGLTLNSTDNTPYANFFELGTFTGTPAFGQLSNLIFDGSNYYFAVSVANKTTISWLELITGKLLLVRINASMFFDDNIDPPIFEELSTSVNTYNYVPLQPAIGWLNNKREIAVSFISRGEKTYLSYFYDDISELGAPIYNLTIDNSLEESFIPSIVDWNSSDNESFLLWFEHQNATLMSAKLVLNGTLRLMRTHREISINQTVLATLSIPIWTLNLTMIKQDSNISLTSNYSVITTILTNSTNYFFHATIGLLDSDYDKISDVEEPVYGGDPKNNDTDFDNILDGSELYIYHTKLNDNDSDDDLATDYQEIRGINIPGVGIRQTNPLKNDTDGDGLLDGEEMLGKIVSVPFIGLYALYADPLDNDTDNDTLTDFEEFNGYTITVEYPDGSLNSYTSYSDPLSADSDYDQLNDTEEWSLGSDALLQDTDNDSLSDFLETLFKTNLTVADTDHDLLIDSLEIYGVNITNPHNGETYTVRPDPLDNDTDNDGLLDGEEVRGFNLTILGVYNNVLVQTDPMDKDCDRDGLSDYEEIKGVNISGTIYITDPWNSDTDGDGLSDLNERVYGTNPLLTDTDHDNLSDGDEINGIYSPVLNKTFHTSPTNNDTDGDGLSDYEEIYGVYIEAINKTYYTDPTTIDTDGDSLSDYNETHGVKVGDETYYLDPTNPDTDFDGVNDYLEIMRYHINPLDNDTDGDGLSDGEEVYGVDIPYIGRRTLDPRNNDTDGDGLSDYEEVHGIDTAIGRLYSDPLYLDTDFDGLSDYQEVHGWEVTFVFLNGSSVTIHVMSLPNRTDTDGDGLSDYIEYYNGGDPLSNDTDGDGLSDYEEFTYKTSLDKQDTDGDGLTDMTEVRGVSIPNIGNVTTNPLKNDTDGDGLSDYEEVHGFDIEGIEHVYTDPTRLDTDNDGLSDYEEVKIRHTNPNSFDSDNDGLGDYEEVYRFGTSPVSNDTDGDGLSDYEEVTGVNVNGLLIKTNPHNNDTDGDGLSDYEEVHGFDIEGIGHRVTDPTREDTDGDGLLDPSELGNKTDPTLVDTDGDGLSDYEEVVIYGTNPRAKDTDGDGLSDYEEVKVSRTNPNDPDTDDDFVPDGVDFPSPTLNNFYLIFLAVIIIVLYAAYTYGLFRDWRDDVLAFGLSDAGGVPMFLLPESFQTSYDINLISSGLLGIHSMISEIVGKELQSFVLSGEIPIFIRKGKYSIAWAFLRKVYPRLVKQLNKLHQDLEETYQDTLRSWSGLDLEVEELKSWVSTRLKLKKPKIDMTVSKELADEFEKEFKQ